VETGVANYCAACATFTKSVVLAFDAAPAPSRAQNALQTAKASFMPSLAMNRGNVLDATKKDPWETFTHGEEAAAEAADPLAGCKCVVGCFVDLDAQLMTWTLNGKHFDDVGCDFAAGKVVTGAAAPLSDNNTVLVVQC
jgi:hypothetical protein